MRLNLPAFLLLSLALHAAALAHWSTPILLSSRAAPALSIGLLEQTTEESAAPPRSPAGATARPIREPAPATARTKLRARPAPVSAAIEARPSLQPMSDESPPVSPGPQALAASAAILHSPRLKAAPPPPAAERLARSDPGPSQRDMRSTAPAPVPAPPEATAPTASDPERADSVLRARLRTDLARHFSYPLLARRRGWEGAVRLKFTVQSDGRLTDARIVQSSGYKILDSSALRSLQGVGYLPELVAWINGQTVDVELPVIYRLRGH